MNSSPRIDGATGEPVWSIWTALAFLLLWGALLVVIPTASLMIAGLLKAPDLSDPEALRRHMEAFAESVQASPLLPVAIASCMLLSWIVVFGLMESLLRVYPRSVQRQALGIRWPTPSWSLAVAVPVGVVLYGVGERIAVGLLDEPTPTGLEQLMQTAVGRAAVVFLALVLAPPAEEIFFRGFLYPPIARLLPPVRAVAANAAIFTIAHVATYGFEPAYLLPVGLLGLGVAALRAWSGSVWPGIVAHGVFNATSIILFLVVKP